MKNEERKCIAVIISKPERKYQEGLLKGISKAAFANNMNVAVFATSLLVGEEGYIEGEVNIYNLINYDKITGVVYALGSFYDSKETEKISGKMKEIAARGIPVVVVDGEVDGLPCYANDDGNAIEDIIDHLVIEHELKDIAYMTGHKGHMHAENALKIYKETMKKHGLSVAEDRTYYGDYWYNEADNFLKQMEASGKGMPEAIVCANEHMAISVYRELYKRGIYVPKHIRLACTSNDADSAPYLLTGENNLENVGFEACESIIRAMKGEEIKAGVTFFPSKNVLMKSVGCGCQRASAYDYSIDRGVNIESDPGYFGESNFSRDTVLLKKDYRSLFLSIDDYTDYIKGFQGFYMCLCEGWDDPNFLIKDTRNNPYSERMQLCYYRKNNSNIPEVFIGQQSFFETCSMFPDLFDNSLEPAFYVFKSIHFQARNYGYAVICSGQNPKVYGLTYNFWLHDVTIGLEAQCRLQSVNYMFYTDIMTGLYNRNGFNTMLADVCEDSQKADLQVLFALADLNFLKRVNDNYGHEEGDAAIKSAAVLLKKQKVPEAVYEKNFRIGGDEFVKIAIGDFTEKGLAKFKEDLYKSVAAFSDKSGKPYKTEMSLGYCFGKVENLSDMETLLSKADKKMYAEKLRLKGCAGR